MKVNLTAETLSIILDEPSLCNQTITFNEESIEVNKYVLAAHSTYFRSLWFLEFGDKLANPIDFSHLPVDSNNFFAFLKSFFGKSFTLNESNAYDFYYLVHYFQVNKLIYHIRRSPKHSSRDLYMTVASPHQPWVGYIIETLMDCLFLLISAQSFRALRHAARKFMIAVSGKSQTSERQGSCIS
ncbi:hypothetical protein GEMRC1_010266 [Eukaryota sp. GEM-RC1]